MSNFLKNGGWRGIGEVVAIRFDGPINGRRLQICSFTRQADANGMKRSRVYYEIRSEAAVVHCPAAVKSLKAAKACAESLEA